MGYCPDCGWDGYLEGVSKPCGGLGGGPDRGPDPVETRARAMVAAGRLTTEQLEELGFEGSGGYIGMASFGNGEREPGYGS